MNFSTWLDGERGRVKLIAEAFRLTPGAVSQWRTLGVPVSRMRAVQAVTGGLVTLDDMVPGDDAPDAPQIQGASAAQPGTEVQMSRNDQQEAGHDE